MNKKIVILSDSLDDLSKNSTDFMIIEEQLKNHNPQFDEKEKSLHIEVEISDNTQLLNIIFDIIEQYGLTYYQVWMKEKEDESGQYTKGLSIEVVRENEEATIKLIKPLLGSWKDWKKVLI